MLPHGLQNEAHIPQITGKTFHDRLLARFGGSPPATPLLQEYLLLFCRMLPQVTLWLETFMSWAYGFKLDPHTVAATDKHEPVSSASPLCVCSASFWPVDCVAIWPGFCPYWPLCSLKTWLVPLWLAPSCFACVWGSWPDCLAHALVGPTPPLGERQFKSSCFSLSPGMPFPCCSARGASQDFA